MSNEIIDKQRAKSCPRFTAIGIEKENTMALDRFISRKLLTDLNNTSKFSRTKPKCKLEILKQEQKRITDQSQKIQFPDPKLHEFSQYPTLEITQQIKTKNSIAYQIPSFTNESCKTKTKNTTPKK